MEKYTEINRNLFLQVNIIHQILYLQKHLYGNYAFAEILPGIFEILRSAEFKGIIFDT